MPIQQPLLERKADDMGYFYVFSALKVACHVRLNAFF